MTKLRFAVLLALLCCVRAGAGEETFRFPPPEFQSGYRIPSTATPSPVRAGREVADAAALLGALALAAFLSVKYRSRRGLALLSLGSLAYFGFIRQGCVCPAGSVQNVALAAEGGAVLPWLAAAFFALPLLFALFFGRSFCAAVCPLGAAQELALLKPLRVPERLAQALGLLPWFFLALAALLAATGAWFPVCRLDPFVTLFRLGGTETQVALAAGALLTCMFVGRAYCRFVCPYGVLLGLAARLSKFRVTTTPSDCVNCGLCREACPYGALRGPATGEVAENLPGEKRTLALLLAAAPLLALGGYFAGGTLGERLVAAAHPETRLAELLIIETGRENPAAPEVAAFRAAGGDPKAARQRAEALRGRGKTLGAWLGAALGLAAGIKLILLTVRRRRDGYAPDPAACYACGRCFSACPMERSRVREARGETGGGDG